MKSICKKSIILAALIIGIGFVFIITKPVLAQADLGLNYGTELGLGSNDPITMILKILKLFLGLLGLMAVIIIMLGGFKWMASAGNEDAVIEARKTIVNGIIGLVVILASWGIASWVIQTVSQLTTT